MHTARALTNARARPVALAVEDDGFERLRRGGFARSVITFD